MDGMSDIHLYFYIRHNFDGRVVSCTCVQHFTPIEITWESFPLEVGCTQGYRIRTELAHLKIFQGIQPTGPPHDIVNRGMGFCITVVRE